MSQHLCVDCRALPPDEQPKRPRKVSGGPRSQRCREHRTARSVHRKAQAQARYRVRNYGLPEGFYDALYQLQGGRCAWCNKATGKTKALSVDHDHSCCPKSSDICGKCVRGLLCGPCNVFLGYQMGDDPERIRRGARYLDRPPAQELYLNWPPT